MALRGTHLHAIHTAREGKSHTVTARSPAHRVTSDDLRRSARTLGGSVFAQQTAAAATARPGR
eukprot:4318121-Prymnesium_polylepis.1